MTKQFNFFKETLELREKLTIDEVLTDLTEREGAIDLERSYSVSLASFVVHFNVVVFICRFYTRKAVFML